MSGKVLRFHDEAIAEALGAHDWYAERSEQAARLFLEELDGALGKVSESPQRWPRYLSNTRRLPLHRFPFFVVYVETAAAVEVLAVAHGRRRPGYWRHRIK
jgi:plasmid stabilization system protein ParE